LLDKNIISVPYTEYQIKKPAEDQQAFFHLQLNPIDMKKEVRIFTSHLLSYEKI